MKRILLITIILSFFIASGCESKPSNEEQANLFLSRVLPIPNEELVKVINFDNFEKTSDSNTYNEEIKKVILSMCDGTIDEDVLNTYRMPLFQSITMYHTDAYLYGYEVHVDSIKVEPSSNGKNFTYEANVTLHLNDSTLNNSEHIIILDNSKHVITGVIQFNDANLINYVTFDYNGSIKFKK